MVLDNIVENFEKINNHFGLELYNGPKYWSGKCPIHDGDNPGSLTIYKQGREVNGIWHCYTSNCHEKYGRTILGFIRGLLSKKDKTELSYKDAIKWCEGFFGGKYKERSNDFDSNLTRFLNKSQPIIPDWTFRLTPEQFISKLSTPTFFIKRGYKEETLEHFKVGYCGNKLKPFYERVLVPQFDEEGFVIGCLGRSIYEKCQICKNFHNPHGICKTFPKWRNSENFPSYYTLYNFYLAKPYINNTGIALVTESSPNVWKLKEADFPMAVGTYGAKFSDVQKNILDTLNCHTIIIVPDNGEPGKLLVNQVHERCRFTHNIVTITPSYKDDIGALNIETVKNIIGPYIKNCRGY